MFLSTFLLVFLAEMADKTQFLILAFTRRYTFRSILLGMTLAIALLCVLSVGAGSWIQSCVPLSLVRFAAAVLFLCFGFHALRQSKEENPRERQQRWPWFSVALAFFIAELGDKTQLATITIAAQSTSPFSVYWGSFAGLFAANLLALTLGRLLFRHISEATMHLISATVFFLFGSLSLIRLFSFTQAQLILYCLLLFTTAYFYACWQQRKKEKPRV